MDKCPYCGAETREGDNFCLNCGHRLVPTSSSASEQGQPDGSAPMSYDDSVGSAQSGGMSSSGWPDTSAQTVASAEQSAFRAEAPQATMDRIENPALLVLRAEDGTLVQEYPLDKMEMTIGRAPTSDILLSKDKLTSRRHAMIRYENGNYILRDERSANGTFVNGQQIEEMIPRVLQEGDHIGIGEHELLFRSSASSGNIEDMPTISVVYEQAEVANSPREEAMATDASSEDFNTRLMANGAQAEVQPVQEDFLVQEPVDNQADYALSAPNGSVMPTTPEAAPSIPVATSYSPSPSSSFQASAPDDSEAGGTGSSQNVSASSYTSPTSMGAEAGGNVTFNRLTSTSLPGLPDMTALLAALSTLDGQVMSLQEQLNATQESMQNHESEIAQTANQLRAGVRRVSDRMDNTIADVARSREALAWAELSQLMEDVMNNPRDIEYVTRLARKARELNKLFQIHQNVLNTMYECNSLLRSLIGEDR